jgi:hypothetical protein
MSTLNISTLQADTFKSKDNSREFYKCYAWVNFNGTGTVAIRASGNVASITDNGTGDFTVNFTTAMPDANYCVSTTSTAAAGPTLLSIAANWVSGVFTAPTTTAFKLGTHTPVAGALHDPTYVTASVFR